MVLLCTLAHFLVVACMSLLGGVSCGDNKGPHQPPDGPLGPDASNSDTCPEPAVAEGNGCVLQGDVDLAMRGSLELAPRTSLDCGGHKIFTSLPGTDIDHRSTPEIGVLLRGAKSVTLENCVIEGFDFGIFSINSKLPAGADAAMRDMLANRIQSSTVVGRYTAITLLAVDNTRITDSTIKFTTAGGQGVLVLRDSDLNVIKNNQLSIPLNSDATGAVKLPGPVLVGGSQTGGTGAIYVSQGTGLPNLLTAVIGGKLYQWLTPVTTSPNEQFGADNVIEGNTITAATVHNDISASVAQRLVIRDNQLNTARIGILFGAATYDVTADFPGVCSADGSRLCFNGGTAHTVCSGDNSLPCSVTADCGASGSCVVNECFVANIDTASKGDCAGKTSMKVYWYSDAALIESNHLTGPFSTGIQVTGPRVIIQDNEIVGPTAVSTDLTMNGTGLDIRRMSLQSGTIRRNKVSGFVAPIRLQSNAANFGARISQNDFATAGAAMFVSSASFPAEISVGTCSGNTAVSCSRLAGGVDDPQTTGVDESTDECASQSLGTCTNRLGNHWGLACATAAGFDGSKVMIVGAGSKTDAQGVVTLTGTATSTSKDGAPYGVSVATLTTLPTTYVDGFCTATP
jgi:hypothetical protein